MRGYTAQAPPPHETPGVILVPHKCFIHLYPLFAALTCLLLFPTPFKLVIDDSVAMTPFYLLLGKHRRQKQENGDRQSSRRSTERTPLPKGSMGVKEVGVCVGVQRRRLDISISACSDWGKFKYSRCIWRFPCSRLVDI